MAQTAIKKSDNSKKIPKYLKQKLTAQAINEIVWARQYKQGKVKYWQYNEMMYYSKKRVTNESRANVDLARMQNYVHRIESKIDNPLVFKFTKRKNSQLLRVNNLNSLKTYDHDRDNWDIKDLVGKKQMVIYGRMMYCYYADSIDGNYMPHLDNVDVYDFLIDPGAGGIDLEKAMYLGRWGVVKSKEELQDGADSGMYDVDVVNQLVAGTGNNTELNQEETNKLNRMYNQNTIGQKELVNDNKYKFWEWYTTFYNTKTKKTERYYLLMQERAGLAIRVERLTDLFTPTDEFPLGAYPFWSAAAFPDLTEFWTPSYCDYVRELLQAQYASINQMLDNGEAVNKPLRAINVATIQNEKELEYRRSGYIKFKDKTGTFDVNKAVQSLNVPPIETPIAVFNILEEILQDTTGITPNTKGEEDGETPVAIYEGNQKASDDLFKLLNRSYSFGYRRFAKLYELGVRDNLTKKVAIDIIGPDGVQVKEVRPSEIFRKTDRFGTIVEASNADFLGDTQQKEAKLQFLSDHEQDPQPIQNPKKAYEMQAKAVGFTQEEIAELMDTSEFGNAQLVAQVDGDIESILEGKTVLNRGANMAYLQRMVDWMNNNMEDLMQDNKYQKMTAYVDKIMPIAKANEQRAFTMFQISKLNQMASATVAPSGQPAPQPQPPQPAAPANGGLPVENNNLAPV